MIIYLKIGAVGIDYRLDPVNIMESSPNPDFQVFSLYAFAKSGFVANYPYVTLNGVVVEGTRINYILVAAYFKGTIFEWDEWDVELAGDFDQWRRSRGPDSPAAHEAAQAGFDLFKLYTVNTDDSFTLKSGLHPRDVLTPNRVLKMRDALAFKASFYWPSQSAATELDSLFRQPDLLMDLAQWLHDKGFRYLLE